MTDLELIRAISNKLNFSLKEIQNTFFSHSTNGYVIDKNRVIKINIYNIFVNENEKISQLPPEIFELQFLEELYASYNHIEYIPADISKLSKLKKINFARNRINEVPKIITSLNDLEYFNLSYNKIEELSEEIIHIPTSIHYQDTEIFNIPIGLNLYENPLRKPPLEVVIKGKNAIQNYFNLSKSEETINLNEAKLLIVGQGGVGKTSLMKALVNPENPWSDQQVSTEGIDIHKWNFQSSKGEFTINLWDFGGQEIYHSTHQFFLTKRSLYVFVWEARRDEENLTLFDYWLNVVGLLSDSAPVIMVQNKIDERIINIDEKSIKNRFPNIVAFLETSVKNDIGIFDLSKLIKSEILKLYHIGDKLPLTWINIRKELEALENNFISFDNYLEICKRYNLEYDSATYLSNYLHNLGVFLHFDDNSVLHDILFLKPEWATEAVYKVLDYNKAKFLNGELTRQDFTELWIDYPQQRHNELLELMKKFELCLELPSTDTFIIPEHLPHSKPDFLWSDIDNFRFEFLYEFMPAGIISRLIVRTSDLNKERIFWKSGLVLQLNDSRALIESNPFSKKILIRIIGNDRLKLFSLVRRELDIIHLSLNNPAVHERLPCICNQCIESKDPFSYSYEFLERLQKIGKNFVTCEKSVKEVSIKKLLGEINGELGNELISQQKEKKRIQLIVGILGAAAFIASTSSLIFTRYQPDSPKFQIAIIVITILVILIFVIRKRNREK